MKSWESFLESLESDLGKETVDRWLRSLKIAKFDAGNLYLLAQDSFQIDWFEEHIRPRIKGKFFNNNYRPISVHISSTKEPLSTEAKRGEIFSPKPDSLDGEMTFENFVFSPKVDVAKQLILEIEKKSFNPLLFYGKKGSGKTHLLMATAHLLTTKRLNVFFVKAEKFTEHVVAAIRLQKMQEFRRVYREIDALIVDDIQDLKGKAATQEEFFHTFNTLHMAGKYILLSANSAPSQLTDIEPRLISRFEWGLSVGLEPCSIEVILKKKMDLWNCNLSAELFSWLISSFPSNPLNAFHCLAVRSKGHSLSVEAARFILKDLLAKEEMEAVTPEKIIKAVAAHYGIRTEDLLGKSHCREFAHPRKAAMYLCREKLKLPFQKIGEIFCRDHSTVIASVDHIEKRDTDRAFLLNLKF